MYKGMYRRLQRLVHSTTLPEKVDGSFIFVVCDTDSPPTYLNFSEQIPNRLVQNIPSSHHDASIFFASQG